MQFTMPEQSDWHDNMPICLYDYAPVLLVNVPLLVLQGTKPAMKVDLRTATFVAGVVNYCVV